MFGYLSALHGLPIASITPAQVRAVGERVEPENGADIAKRTLILAAIFSIMRSASIFSTIPPRGVRVGCVPCSKSITPLSLTRTSSAF
jgi:hypothetical protein